MRLFALTTALLIALSIQLAIAQPLADIEPEALLANGDHSMLVLDVRSEDEYQQGHVPGAIHIPYQELAKRTSELEAFRNKPVVVYCESGRRAGIAASTLQEQGFENVLHLVGDMRDWRKSGRAIAF